MISALRGNDPVIFFESQRIYGVTEWFASGGVPREPFAIPIGLPEVKRPGRDITILTIGATLYRALEAAERMEGEHGISAELIDARSLVPFDYGPVLESVRKTGRILITGDACERGSHLNTLAAAVGELAFDDLDAPVAILGARNWITPAAEMENLFFPTVDTILDAVSERLVPLPGRTPSANFSHEEMLRRHRLGI
jgi:2-oxoisovalerate dehydrogenase E1 component